MENQKVINQVVEEELPFLSRFNVTWSAQQINEHVFVGCVEGKNSSTSLEFLRNEFGFIDLSVTESRELHRKADCLLALRLQREDQRQKKTEKTKTTKTRKWEKKKQRKTSARKEGSQKEDPQH